MRVIEREAVQWTGKNLDEVRELCPGAYTVDSGWTLAIPLPEDRRIPGVMSYLIAHLGYYVIRSPVSRDLFIPMAATPFEETYEVAPDTE